MTRRLTRKEWLAIEEALSSRVAAQGEIDIDIDEEEFDLADYETALDWVFERNGRQSARKGQTDE